MERLTALSLLFISNLLFAGNLSDYINQTKTYGSSPPVGTIQNQLNTLFCNGTNCSYSGVDYHSFDRENEARNLYLEKASNPNDPLGQGLSTMWKLSEIKSTTPYKEAEKLYECVKISPDGKCEVYQAETYYGECKTVQECISWNTQKFYANYTCTIDSLFEQRVGETEELCFKYNVIEPQLKEKYYTCFVVQNEETKSCYKERVIHFGVCENPVGVSSITYTLLSGCFGPKCTCVNTDPTRFYACGKHVSGSLSLPKGAKVILKWSTCCVCDDDTGHLIIHISGNHSSGSSYTYNYDKLCPSGGVVTLTTSSGGYLSYDVGYYDTSGADGATVQIIVDIPYRCSLSGQTFLDKSTCLANCYTEEIQDCSVE